MAPGTGELEDVSTSSLPMRDLRQVADVYVENPDWSPDGSMIAFDDGAVINYID